MQSLDSFIPIDRRRELSGSNSIPNQSIGSVLFADISGFSQLTSKLADEHGIERAADEISVYLNLVYGKIIEQVHIYHGCVISFAGDAITCWFDEDDGKRSIAAATVMMRAFNETTNKESIDLELKIGIAHGLVRRVIVGDSKIQLMDIIAGEPVSLASLAEKMAKPGEIIITDVLASRCEGEIRTGGMRKDGFGNSFLLLEELANEQPSSGILQVPQLSANDLSKWVLKDVRNKIEQSEERYLAELRIAVSLFLKFEGLDFNADENATEKLDEFIKWVQGIVTKYDGNLLQVIMGDKGDYLYLGFGAVSANEDDASRAVSTAMDLRDLPENLSYIQNLKVGITLGRMRTGPYGSATRRTFSMIGSSANLAARLMEKAENGQILVSEQIAGVCQDQFRFNSIGSERFKGFQEMIPIFELEGKKVENAQTHIYTTPLVGRKAEIEKINSYLDEVKTEIPKGFLRIEGEGGIGKSRLVAEVVQRSRELDLGVVLGFGYSIERLTPYYVFGELFRQLFSTEGKSTEELLADLAEVLDTKHPDKKKLLPLIGDILPLDVEENNLTQQMVGEIRASNLQDLVSTLITMVAHEKRMLLIIDDAHWVDSASWSLLYDIQRAHSSLGLIISSRPFVGSPPSDFVKLCKEYQHQLISLDNFGREHVKELVCQVLGTEELPNAVLDIVLEKTSGQPFFTEEITYTLLDTGVIEVKGGECIVNEENQNAANTIPDTLQSAITSRLDRITHQQQMTLKVASIVGKLFLLNEVHGIHPISSEISVIKGDIDEMTQLNLTVLQILEPQLGYGFKQSIIYDVSYSLLSFSQRQELHKKAAEWYESNYAETLAQYYSRLGYHWNQAEFYDQATSYFEKAGFNATEKGAYRDGIAFLMNALESGAKINMGGKRKSLLLIDLGIAHFKIGELDEATKFLRQGIRGLRYPAPANGLELVINLTAQIFRQFWHRIRPSSKNKKESKNRQTKLTVSRALEFLAQSYFHHNSLFFSLDSGLTSLNIAESAGTSSQLARAYGSLCVSSSTMPIPGLYETYANLAKETLGTETSLSDHGRVIELIGVALSGKGRWLEIEEVCSEAMRMADEIGDKFLFMENTCILAACYLPQGKTSQSTKLRQDLYEIGTKDQVELVQGWALLQLSEISLLNKENEESLELLEKALEVEEVLGQPDKLWLHGLFSASYTNLGQSKKALESAEHALALSRKSLPTSFFVLEGYSGMVKAFMTEWETDLKNSRINKLVSKSLNSFSKYATSFPIGQPRYLYWKGKQSQLKGNLKKALKFWKKGLETAIEMDMLYEQTFIHDILSKNLPDDTEKKYHTIQKRKVLDQIS